MEESLFDYILFFAIENSIKCNNYCIYLSSLHNYREEIINQLKLNIDTILNNRSKEVKLMINSFFKSNINMTKEDELKLFKSIQAEYRDYFILYNNKIYINSTMSYKDFAEKRNAIEDSIERETVNIIYTHACSFEAYEKLGTTSIMNDVKKLINVEKAVEESYKNQDIDSQNIINIGNYYVIAKFILLASKPFHIVNEYYELINKYSKIDNYNSRITDVVLSEETMKNDRLFLANPYIDDELSSTFQKAIFDEDNLHYSMLLNNYDLIWEYMYKDELEYIDNDELLDDIYTEEILDEDEYDSTEYDRKIINLWFYMNYIKKVEEYQNKTNSEELKNIKNRLLYALNRIDKNLLNNKHFEKIYQEYSKLEFSNDDYIEISVMARILLNDLLRGNIDDLALRKVIFISNYYDLTNDKKIKKRIIKAKNTNNIFYSSVYDAIINNNYSKFSKKSIQKIKDKLKE